MADRFSELKEELLRAGVGPRYVRRAVLEIEAHFSQLLHDELVRGTSDADARHEAYRRLGTNRVLVQGYATRPDLRAWARRWPAIWFIVLALASYIALSASSLVILHALVEHLKGYLHRVPLAPDLTYRIDLMARIIYLWIFPWCVASAWAVLAYRRRVELRWPIAGIVAICVLASLLNITLMLTGGATPGEYGAGIGVSLESLPGQLGRAAILASPLLVALYLATRRVRRDHRMT
jgi:hypothetical protein